MGNRGLHSVRLTMVALAGFLAACSAAGGDTSVDARVDTRSPGTMSRSFGRAAERAAVPRDLLVAIAHVEQGLDIPARRLDLEDDAAVPAAGPLMLRHGKLDTLARGAKLASTTELALRQDADLALDAGALVLAELGNQTGARASDLGSWRSALEEMSGYADAQHREEYAHRVFATLARGGNLEARDGEVIYLDKHDLPPTLTLDVSSKLHALAVSQFPGALWVPTSCTNKCTDGRGGNAITTIVIHDTEGGWDASVATLQNDPQKSVQYIVGTDGKVAQFVTEETTAWHAGNFYFNQRSVGIEHVGYANKPFTEPQYAASAKLVDYLAKKYNVAKDRAHIIGHDQIPNGTNIAESAAPCSDSPKACEANVNFGGASHHTDPGVWEWPTFMARLGASSKCNDVTNLWNCSYDHKQAFRCVGTAVTVELCDGAGACEVKAVGQDDVCHAGTKPTGTPAGTPPTSTDPGNPAPPQTTGTPLPEYLAPSGAPAESSGGCNVSTHAESGSLGLILFAATLAASRRRRRS